MRIKLHLMGSLKQKFVSKNCPDQNCYMEVNETATPRDLINLLGVEDENVLAFINGKPVDLDERLQNEDRLVLMRPDSKET